MYWIKIIAILKKFFALISRITDIQYICICIWQSLRLHTMWSTCTANVHMHTLTSSLSHTCSDTQRKHWGLGNTHRQKKINHNLYHYRMYFKLYCNIDFRPYRPALISASLLIAECTFVVVCRHSSLERLKQEGSCRWHLVNLSSEIDSILTRPHCFLSVYEHACVREDVSVCVWTFAVHIDHKVWRHSDCHCHFFVLMCLFGELTWMFQAWVSRLNTQCLY